MVKSQYDNEGKRKFKIDPLSVTLGVTASAFVVGVTLMVVLLTKKKISSTSAPILQASVSRKKYLMGSFSHYSSTFPNMWTENDFMYTDVNGKKLPWQNYMITDDITSWVYYATIWTTIYKATGVKLTVFWKYTFVRPDDVITFNETYQNLLVSFPDLPPAPTGVFVCDRPTDTQVLGDTVNDVISLTYLCSILKTYWPNAHLYGNFNYSQITGSVLAVSAIGESDLDYISVQDFTQDFSTFQNGLKTYLYPNIKDSQKVLVISFAAYGNGSTPGTAISPSTADAYCLVNGPYSALAMQNWLQSDSRIYGIIVYNLKNINWSGSGDITANASGTGVGLVDTLQNSSTYVMPNTVNFYKNLGAIWTTDNVTYNL
jgi:hypothetical protein